MNKPLFQDNIAGEHIDAAYAAQSPSQRLDLYLPKGGGPFPLILVIHGGAWLWGDKSDCEVGWMLHGLARGYAVASMNYRLSPEAPFPAQIYDVKAAIRYLRAHAGELGLDAGRFCACGSSAGGHLAALAGTSGAVGALEDLTMGNDGQPSAVQAVVDWFGPTDFLAMDEQLASLGLEGDIHTHPESPESLLLGRYIIEAPELVRAASPMTYISPESPPFLIRHGRLDTTVCCLQSAVLAEALKQAGIRVELDLIDGAGHGGPAFDTPQSIARALDFIDQYLKG